MVPRGQTPTSKHHVKVNLHMMQSHDMMARASLMGAIQCYLAAKSNS